jgi:hypothetical protein
VAPTIIIVLICIIIVILNLAAKPQGSR